ncbi:hypothetical protein Tco_0394150 [Tanacetum coccineum]
MDTAYGRRWIHRIGNYEYAFSCEDLALIRHISFPGYNELEAHYMYMAKIQEVIPSADEDTGPIFDKEPSETIDSNITPASSDMCNDEGKVDQDNAQEDEGALLASSIQKMKLKIDEAKRLIKS